MFCEKCGKEINDDAKFCSGCGASTGTIEEETNVNMQSPSAKAMLTLNKPLFGKSDRTDEEIVESSMKAYKSKKPQRIIAAIMFVCLICGLAVNVSKMVKLKKASYIDNALVGTWNGTGTYMDGKKVGDSTSEKLVIKKDGECIRTAYNGKVFEFKIKKGDSTGETDIYYGYQDGEMTVKITYNPKYPDSLGLYFVDEQLAEYLTAIVYTR